MTDAVRLGTQSNSAATFKAATAVVGAAAVLVSSIAVRTADDVGEAGAEAKDAPQGGKGPEGPRSLRERAAAMAAGRVARARARAKAKVNAEVEQKKAEAKAKVAALGKAARRKTVGAAMGSIRNLNGGKEAKPGRDPMAEMGGKACGVGTTQPFVWRSFWDARIPSLHTISQFYVPKSS